MLGNCDQPDDHRQQHYDGQGEGFAVGDVFEKAGQCAEHSYSVVRKLCEESLVSGL